MKKWFEKFMKIFLTCLILIGFVASVTFVIVKNNEGIPEKESAALLKQEHRVTENFAELSKIKGAELKVKEEKVIVTFYETETKLEAIYDQEYNLISSAIIHNRIYDEPAGICLVIIIGGLMIPAIIWLVVCAVMATIHDVIVALKKKKQKQKEQNNIKCTPGNIDEIDLPFHPDDRS